ncbi:hypothetical protein [Citrobacter freundii]|uniref:hypothetical protein n=1 Tax=Citrobacter freundii TaxID=546 RepID=UPI001904DD0A|nr:hypothetical protein [Citrobacter freundii]MBJ8931639.1 hypothetical protein [Citrobacter freundii]
MNLSNNAKKILNFIINNLSSQLGTTLPVDADFRKEISYQAPEGSKVFLAVGLSEGVFEVSLHERRPELSSNLLYATIVLDQPENSATMIVTSDSDDTSNCEVVFPVQSISDSSYEHTVQTVLALVEELLAALEPIQ